MLVKQVNFINFYTFLYLCLLVLGHKQLNETEFYLWVKKIEALSMRHYEDAHSEDLVAAFRVFDVDHNGFITRDELRTAMEVIGETVTENQLTEFIALADTDKDGKINYEG